MKVYHFYHFTRGNSKDTLLTAKIKPTGCGELGKGFYTWGILEAAIAAAPEWATAEGWNEGWCVIRFAVPESVLLESSLFYETQALSDKRGFLDYWFGDVETADDEEEEEEEDAQLAEGVTSLQVSDVNNNNNVTNSNVTAPCTTEVKNEQGTSDDEEDEEDQDQDEDDDQGEDEAVEEYEHTDLNVLFFEDKDDSDRCREPGDDRSDGYEIEWKDFVTKNEGKHGEKHTDWRFDVIIAPHKGKVKLKKTKFVLQYAFNEAIDILNDPEVKREVVHEQS